MPSVVYKKSVEGFGITFIEAASYGKSIGGIGWPSGCNKTQGNRLSLRWK